MAKSQPLPVIYEDNHLLVVNKPAGLATMGTRERKPSVVTLAKEYLKHKYGKPGNVYLGVVSRLDAEVSGVLVLARTSKAAARLSEQFREAAAEKTYWALVDGRPPKRSGRLVHWVRKDEARQRMVARETKGPGFLEARLSYHVAKNIATATLVEVRLETGRKHQIRLQLSESGFPILGDRKYGSRRSFPRGIALHSRALTIEHPTLKKPMTFHAPLPRAWHDWKALAEGDAAR